MAILRPFEFFVSPRPDDRIALCKWSDQYKKHVFLASLHIDKFLEIYKEKITDDVLRQFKRYPENFISLSGELQVGD
jgi:hypothetical protein